MKILAISLDIIAGYRSLVEHGYFDVKETKIGYKVTANQPNDLLVNCKTLVKKDEVDTVFFDESLGGKVNERRATSIKLKVWVPIQDDGETNNDEILKNYERKLKIKALIELNDRMKSLKELIEDVKKL